MKWAYRLGYGLAVLFAPAVGWAQGTGTPIPPMLPNDQPVQTQASPAAAGISDQYLAERNHSKSLYDTYGQSEGGFPSTDVRIAVDADARAAFARMQLLRTQDDLYAAVEMVKKQFERSKEMTDAVAAEKQAYQEYLDARQAALKGVMDDPNYKAHAQIKQDLAGQIADAREARQPDPAPMLSRTSTEKAAKADLEAANATVDHQVFALSVVKLDYAGVIHDMESKVLADNANVQAARKKLMAAGQKIAELRDQFDLAVRSSPELTALRARYEDARIANVVAATYRRSAYESANAAVDYAYYLNRFNFYNSYPYNNSAQPVFGTGYGYPFGR